MGNSDNQERVEKATKTERIAKAKSGKLGWICDKNIYVYCLKERPYLCYHYIP